MFKLMVKSEIFLAKFFQIRKPKKSYGWTSPVVLFGIFNSSNVVSSGIASIIRHFRSMNQMRRLFTARYGWNNCYQLKVLYLITLKILKNIFLRPCPSYLHGISGHPTRSTNYDRQLQCFLKKLILTGGTISFNCKNVKILFIIK